MKYFEATRRGVGLPKKEIVGKKASIIELCRLTVEFSIKDVVKARRVLEKLVKFLGKALDGCYGYVEKVER